MKYFILIRDTKENCKLSYYDTRLGIVNNWASPSTFGWSAVDNYALNSVFTNFFNKFSANSAQIANNADLSTISNPFSFGNLASGWSFPQMNWSFPQTNWSLASTSSGGDWFSNAFGSLGSFGSLSSPGGGYNSGPVNIPSYASQNNRNKIKELDPLMQQAVVELMEYAHAQGIPFEIKEGYCPAEVRKARRDKAIEEGKGREAFYAKDGNSKHIFRKAIDLDRKVTSPEDLKRLGQKWTAMQCEWGGRWKNTDHSRTEIWHFALEAQGQATRYKPNGNYSSGYADGGYSSPWSGYGWSMPVFSSSLSGFGSGFGGSWFNTMFSSSLGGWGGGYSGGRSSTRALPSQHAERIQKYCDQYGYDAKLVSCVVHGESGGKVNAVSSANARGVMQIKSCNYKHLGITDPFDLDQNIGGGVRLLKEWTDKYHGDVRTALAAYNWGPGNIDNLVKQYGTTDYNVIGPHVLWKTQKYVKDIMDRYNSSGGSSGGGYLSV